VQDHERPMLGSQVTECAVERIPVIETSEVVVGRRRLGQVAAYLDHPSLTATSLVDGRVNEQPIEPAVKAVGVTQAWEVAPGADECLLDRVTREFRVAEDEASGRVQPREPGIDERGEGVVIASLGPLDLDSLVHGRL